MYRMANVGGRMNVEITTLGPDILHTMNLIYNSQTI